jgi:LEA14-like dessication related protein
VASPVFRAQRGSGATVRVAESRLRAVLKSETAHDFERDRLAQAFALLPSSASLSLNAEDLVKRASIVAVGAVSLVVINLALAGCSLFVPKLETPKLSVVNVEVLKSDLWEQRMKVRMRVANPNDRPIPVKGLTVALDVQGQELAHGVSAAAFDVPALGEAEFDMNMTANMAGAILKILGSRNSNGNSMGDSVDYRIKGKLSLSEGLMRSIPFEDHGTFNFK